MHTNYNHNDAANVAQLKEQIAALLEKLPVASRLYEQVKLKNSLSICTHDCVEATLAMFLAQLKVIVRKGGK